jgi:L-serine dehydratase
MQITIPLRNSDVISVFDMFKTGIGPPGSHAAGPVKAGKQFVSDLVSQGVMFPVTTIVVEIYDSL